MKATVFGFMIAAWVLKDVISGYMIIGVVIVITGLLLSKLNTKKNEVVFD
jgi:drug/metabolite transporter (DMT)-like permease